MRIKIVEVGPVVYEKTAKGGYSHFTISYDKGEGKPWKRKLVSFVKPDTAYQTLKNAKVDEQYDVEQVKDEQGNWQWPSAVLVDQTNVVEAAKPLGGAMKSTYETPEERARRQVLIVRQSCVAQAVAFYGHTDGGYDVLEKAAEFEAWVNR